MAKTRKIFDFDVTYINSKGFMSLKTFRGTSKTDALKKFKRRFSARRIMKTERIK